MESFSPSASSAALLAPPHHAAWLAAQLRLAPARPAETLVQYVARRLLVAGNADPAPALRAQLAQVAETEGGEGVMGDLFDFEGYGSDGPDSATTQMLALESFSNSPYAALDPEDSVFASRTPSAEAPEPFFSGAVGDADAMVVDPAMLASSASAVPPNAADASPEPPLRTKRPQPAAKTSSSGAHRWADSRDKLNTILAVQRFSKSPTETSFTLSHLLSSFQTPPKVVSEWSDGSFVPPAGRVEVLNAVRENGKAAFFKAFVHDGVDTLQRWALGVSSSKTLDRANKEAELQVTAEPLLQVSSLFSSLSPPTKQCGYGPCRPSRRRCAACARSCAASARSCAAIAHIRPNRSKCTSTKFRGSRFFRPNFPCFWLPDLDSARRGGHVTKLSIPPLFVRT